MWRAKTMLSRSWVVLGLCLALPMASSFITYIFVSAGTKPIELDATQGYIVSLALIKMIILGSTGVFPINLNDVFKNVLRGKDRRGSHIEGLYEVPPVDVMPCTRRLLCEMEMAAKTSEDYHPKGPANEDDEERHPEEEAAPEEVDPLNELHIEAIKAFYREDAVTDFSPHSRKALMAIEELTGTSCEKAYSLCPGRFTPAMIFKTVFDEIDFTAAHHNEL